MVERKYVLKYILSAIAAALLAAPLSSFAQPIGTIGTFGANPGVGPAPITGGGFNPSPGYFGPPNAGAPMFGSPGAGSSVIGSVGSTMPGSSSIGSVGSMPGPSTFQMPYPNSGISSPGINSNGTIAHPLGPCIPGNMISSC
jgi:hypothetical protein